MRFVKLLILILFICLLLSPLAAGEIHDAVEKNQPTLVRALLEKTPDCVNQKRKGGEQPLHIAANSGYKEIAGVLVGKGADINGRSDQGATPAYFAAAGNHVEILNMLLQKGADLTSRTQSGASLLHGAAWEGHKETAQLLISKGIDLEAQNGQKATPLQWAVYSGKIDVVDFLISKGAKYSGIFDMYGNNPLIASTFKRNIGMIKLLLKRGVDVNEKAPNGYGAVLHLAVRCNIEIVKLLIDSGADVNRMNANGVVPLMGAAASGNKEMVNLLLEKGAIVNIQNEKALCEKKGNCYPIAGVLHNALYADKGRHEVLEILLKHKADTNFANEAGASPLHLAAALGDLKSTQLLVQHGAAIDIKEKKNGSTPLLKAVINGYCDVVSYLISKGARGDVKNNPNLSPLYYAGRHGHKQIYQLLVKKDGTEHKSVETNFGKSKYLAAKLDVRQAYVWFLGHSGWAVKTKNNLLIFDYNNDGREPTEALIANGHISCEELKGLTVSVLVSHFHGDHFDNEIFDWKEKIENITYIYGFRPETACEPGRRPQAYKGPAYEFIAPRMNKKINGLDITTIESTDTGVAFLVKVDGVVIYHAGDHANSSKEMKGPYVDEIDWLAAKTDEVDIGFFPASGCRFGGKLDELKMGIYYAADKLHPKMIFPMHSGNMGYKNREFAQEAKKKMKNLPILYAEERGERFFYEKK
ncbi:MAG: hypothetical protein GY757_42240 [bacterium]|nr:hypothetical protein [bacterium]